MKKNWFSVTQLQTNVYALAEFSHWEQVVSYLVLDKTQAFLIDTGMGYASIRKCIANITNLPVTVLLTHSHWDHIGDIQDFKNIQLFNNTFEIDNLKKGFSSEKIEELCKKELFSNGFVPKKYVVEGTESIKLFTDSEIIQSNSFSIQVIHTPGHTPGSVCFYIKELHSIFTGDTLYPGPIYVQLEESNLQDYTKSIAKLHTLLDKNVSIFPGHNKTLSSFLLLQEAYNLVTINSYEGKQLSILCK